MRSCSASQNVLVANDYTFGDPQKGKHVFHERAIASSLGFCTPQSIISGLINTNWWTFGGRLAIGITFFLRYHPTIQQGIHEPSMAPDSSHGGRRHGPYCGRHKAKWRGRMSSNLPTPLGIHVICHCHRLNHHHHHHHHHPPTHQPTPSQHF